MMHLFASQMHKKKGEKALRSNFIILFLKSQESFIHVLSTYT